VARKEGNIPSWIKNQLKDRKRKGQFLLQRWATSRVCGTPHSASSASA